MATEFKEIILKLRDEKNMTQSQLADSLDISKSTVAMWETGKRFPSAELYEHIADLFNVDIDYLYGRTTIRKKVHFDEDGVAYAPFTIAAHFDGDEFTDDELEDIADYIEFVKNKRK